MTGFLIAMFITVLAAWFIIKNYQPQTILLLAGLSMLLITALFFPEHSILYGNAKSIGWVGGDIFAFVKESLATQVAGIGLIIRPREGSPIIWIISKPQMRWLRCALSHWR